MNDLRAFTALQARIYEFLEQQDEATLRAIVSGEAQLVALRADDAPAAVSSRPRDDLRPPVADLPTTSSRDRSQAIRDLSGLTSEEERRTYLNAAKLRMKELREIAKLRGVAGYSRLKQTDLINLLVGLSPDQTNAGSGEPTPPAPPPPDPVDGGPAAEQQVTSQEAGSSTATAGPSADVAAIASRLRTTDTEEEGAAYLHAQQLDRESLLAVAAELGLTRVDRLSQKELRRRVLKQAIGARRKFAGLRRW